MAAVSFVCFNNRLESHILDLQELLHLEFNIRIISLLHYILPDHKMNENDFIKTHHLFFWDKADSNYSSAQQILQQIWSIEDLIFSLPSPLSPLNLWKRKNKNI